MKDSAMQAPLSPSPLSGEGGAKRRMRGALGQASPSSVSRLPARSTFSRKGRRGGAAAVGAVLLMLSSAAHAQTATTTTTAPTITSGQPQGATFGQNGATTIKKLLADGYEIKTGFVDPTGGAYLALQKTTSAYFCHSNPNPTCEKLN